MKYVNQNDYGYVLYPINTGKPEDERNADDMCCTFADAGCCLAAAIMAADRLLIEPAFGIVESLELAFESKANHIAGTDFKRYAPAFANKFGLKYKPSDSADELIGCLRTCGVAILHSSGDCEEESHTGVFTHGGHFLTAISVDEDGRVALLDPSLTDTKYLEEGRRGKVEVRSKLCLADVSVINEDCRRSAIPYFLFWRG